MFFNTFAPETLVALIGIFFTLIVGVLNVFISIHKSQTEILIRNKVESLDRIRLLSGKILGWRYDKSIVELRSTISQLIFYFDPSISSDNEVVKVLLQMLENAYRLSFYTSFKSKESKKTYEKYHESKKEFNFLMKLVLKREQIRIDVENQVFKIPFHNYWIPFLGFNAEWATNSLKRKMKDVYSSFPEAWLLLEGEKHPSHLAGLTDLLDPDTVHPSPLTDEKEDQKQPDSYISTEDSNNQIIEITFLHPTTGATLTAKVNKELTAKEIIDELIKENFLAPIEGKEGMYNLCCNGEILEDDQTLTDNYSEIYHIVTSSYAG